jgi:hypothetical protein
MFTVCQEHSYALLECKQSLARSVCKFLCKFSPEIPTSTEAVRFFVFLLVLVATCPVSRLIRTWELLRFHSKLEESSDEVEDVKDDRPIGPASEPVDLLASRLTL